MMFASDHALQWGATTVSEGDVQARGHASTGAAAPAVGLARRFKQSVRLAQPGGASQQQQQQQRRAAFAHTELRTRETVVRSIYPRLLYAFSDVVCYVTKNAR